MNKNNLTSLSFTVEDDLISQSSLNNTRMTAFHGLKPFSKQYNHQQQQILPKNIRDIKEKAKRDAYRQLNDETYNPFQHKLNNNFIPSQAQLYHQQKQKQIELLKNKQQQMMSSSKNYTIVFNHKANNTKVFQMAANNVLTEDNSIQDYYQRKFKKTNKIDSIQEENQIDDQHNQIKQNNFVNSVKKKQKPQRKVISQGTINETRYPSFKQQKQPSLQQINDPPKVTNKNNNHKNILKKNSQKKQVIKQKSNNKANGQFLNGKQKYSQIYDGPDRNLVEQLERQLSQCPTVTFDQIAELENAKNLLQQAVILPRLMPQFFQGIRKAMRGILLFGPPGTGKTLLAKAIANKNVFFNVSASSLASKWKGQSEKMLLFEIAKYYSPSVIFFDEIDCIGSKRSENQHESARKVKTQLLVQMDGVGSTNNQVFVLAATNRPWDLDEALRRRLQKRIYIPLPGKQGRKQMFQINLKGVNLQENINWDKIVEATKGCSGADILNICRDAAYMPMRRKIEQVGGIEKLKQIKESDILMQPLSEKDLLDASKKIKPSVGTDDLKRYSDWMKQFGSS